MDMVFPTQTPILNTMTKNSDHLPIKQALHICQDILKNAYSYHGIQAGSTHFSDVWIRDASFASWGAISQHDYSIVYRFLRHVLDHMHPSGQCPLRIGQKYFFLKYVGIRGPEGATFIEDKYVSVPVDSNALVLITAYHYVQATQNQAFLDAYYAKLALAARWYGAIMSGDLVTEGPYAGWADSIKKRGHVLYTNVLVAHAFSCMAKLADMHNQSADNDEWQIHHQQLKRAINQHFWNQSYLLDWIDGNRYVDQLSIDGNVLAILFDIVSPDRQRMILNDILNRNMLTQYGAMLIDKPYGNRDVYPLFLMIQLKDYHNGMLWLWVSCLLAGAFKKNGYDHEALNVMRGVAQVINRDQTVYEVYESSGHPVNRWFYKSEKGFAWSAGLFMWAYGQLFGELPSPT